VHGRLVQPHDGTLERPDQLVFVYAELDPFGSPPLLEALAEGATAASS
jgi:hypothetical protein